MKTALVIVDMLNDFLEGTLKTKEAINTVKATKQVLKVFRASKLPVIYVNDHHYINDFEIKVWGKHAMAGTEGSRVFAEIAPHKGEYIIEKHTYSGFYGTHLDYILRSNEVDAIMLVGLDADICVRHTAADAFFRGYSIFVVRDAVAARIDQSWEKYFVSVYGAKIINSEDIRKAINIKWKGN
ncbi:MAG: cysteine hydrolase [Nitrososphaerota archaeon]|nr:cysteine hydrolase [Nitrososphaerota archaeon]MDG6930995.1 cysteine hydrolase [Nitrososphaerota archaeon]